MSLFQECRDALNSQNVRAFLRVIRAGESGQEADAYRTIVGGGTFDSFADHPRKLIRVSSLGVNSTAAGAYQFLSRTWDECAKALDLPDFSPGSQDLAAVFLIRRRGALDDVLAGRVEAAIGKCAAEWASLPGSPYGQPTRTMRQALHTYGFYGGQFTPAGPFANVDAPRATTQLDAANIPPGEAAEWPPQTAAEQLDDSLKQIQGIVRDQAQQEPDAPPQPEIAMPLPAILGAILPSLIAEIPRLGQLFGSGSKVSERNVKAAEIAVGIVQQATGAVNAQQAAEKVTADPVAKAAATKAIEARWLELADAGGGGIEGARKADAAYAAMPWHSFMHSPSFWVAVLLLPLVYLIVGNVVGLIGKPLSDEVRSAISNGVVGLVLGGLIGYYYGQTTSRNRTP